MPKRLLTAFAILLMANAGKTQSFLHGVGATISVMHAKVDTYFERSSLTMAFSDATYFPRFTVMEAENSSVSIGAPLGVGIGFSGNTTGSETSLYWGFDLPAVLDYNIGWKSSPDNEQNFGVFFGGGFGYSLTNWSDGYGSSKYSSYGPIARAGVRIGGFDSAPDLGICIGLIFKQGLEAQKFKTYGVQVLLDL